MWIWREASNLEWPLSLGRTTKVVSEACMEMIRMQHIGHKIRKLDSAGLPKATSDYCSPYPSANFLCALDRKSVV